MTEYSIGDDVRCKETGISGVIVEFLGEKGGMIFDGEAFYKVDLDKIDFVESSFEDPEDLDTYLMIVASFDDAPEKLKEKYR